MPVLPDLIDQNKLAAYLAGSNLSSAALALLPDLAASASSTLRRYCNRNFTAASYDELYTIIAPHSYFIVNQFPIISIEGIQTNPQAILFITNTRTDLQKATAKLITTGDSLVGFTVTALNLSYTYRGSVATVSIDLTPSASSPIPNTTVLASTVNAIGSGWLATIADGYSYWPISELRPIQGVQNAINNNSATLNAFVDYVSWNIKESSGIVYVQTPQTVSSSSYSRFGPAFGSEEQDLIWYGGSNGIRALYTAGFQTIPAQIVQFTAEIVKAATERLKTDATLVSESDGTYSWTGRDKMLPIPEGIRSDLGPWVNHRG